MNDCNADCDATNWFMGAPGMCFNGTVCECPTGYNGIDAWGAYNDCHVSIPVKQFVQILAACANLIACGLATMHCLSFMCFWVDPVPTKPSSSPWHLGKSAMFGGGEDRVKYVKRPVNAQSVSQMVIVKKRKALQGLVAALLFLNTALLLPYTLGALNPTPILRYNTRYLIDITLAISFNSGFCAFWVLTYLNFRQLPGMEMLGNMYGLKSIFVRKPALVYQLMVGHVTVITAGNILFMMLLPTIFFEDKEARAHFDRIWLLFAALASIEYFLFFELVGLLLTRLFNEAIKSSLLDINRVTDWSKVFRGKRRLVMLMVSLPVIALLFWVPFFVQFIAYEQRYSYITFSVSSTAMQLGACVGSKFNYVDFLQLRDARRKKYLLEDERLNNRDLIRP